MYRVPRVHDRPELGCPQTSIDFSRRRQAKALLRGLDAHKILFAVLVTSNDSGRPRSDPPSSFSSFPTAIVRGRVSGKGGARAFNCLIFRHEPPLLALFPCSADDVFCRCPRLLRSARGRRHGGTRRGGNIHSMLATIGSESSHVDAWSRSFLCPVSACTTTHHILCTYS